MSAPVKFAIFTGKVVREREQERGQLLSFGAVPSYQQRVQDNTQSWLKGEHLLKHLFRF
jgi:hypothetical protein